MAEGRKHLCNQAMLKFGGVDYDVEINDENGVLVLNVENSDTLDHWTGKYDASYIEELSHKTGNFKQFNIFYSMLESALLNNCQSVSLDLLTYDDLKVLREKKLGSHHRRKQKQNVVEDKLKTKRYLIMTYTVEFDQIHYPLPLMYTGTLDPGALKDQIRELEKENQTLRNRRNNVNSNSSMLDVEYEKTMQKNEDLREELDQCHQQMKEISTGNLGKELKVLKKVVQNLETDLVKERSKHQRLMMKKKKEYDTLIQELEDLKASERNYRVRCKSLTEELAIIKRSSRFSPAINTRKSTTKTIHRNRSTSRERPQQNEIRGRMRSTSTHKRGRQVTSRSVSRERERSISGSSVGIRTPSPGHRRFDPSAYVKEKERKRKESDINRSRRRTPLSGNKRNTTPSYNSHARKPPTSSSISRNQYRRRSSSKENYSAANGSDTDNSVTKLKTKPKRNDSSRKNYQKRYQKSVNSEDEYYGGKPAPRSKVSSVKKAKKDANDNHSIGIAEIDARLEALKNFMKDNMES